MFVATVIGSVVSQQLRLLHPVAIYLFNMKLVKMCTVIVVNSSNKTRTGMVTYFYKRFRDEVYTTVLLEAYRSSRLGFATVGPLWCHYRCLIKMKDRETCYTPYNIYQNFYLSSVDRTYISVAVQL